jgi:hypothetical protein
MHKGFRALLISLTAFEIFSGIRTAEAWPRYVEFGGTMATLTSPSPLFQALEKQSSSSASQTIGIPLTLGIQLQERQRGLLFSFALQTRYLTGTTGAGESFSFFPTSPMLRLEFWRLVLGAGYTTYVWNGFSFKKNASIDSVLTLQAQFLFPITPEIDFGLEGTRTAYTSARYGSEASIMEYGAFFRLNFGMSESAAGERRKFKGWRYPLGSPLN